MYTHVVTLFRFLFKVGLVIGFFVTLVPYKIVITLNNVAPSICCFDGNIHLYYLVTRMSSIVIPGVRIVASNGFGCNLPVRNCPILYLDCNYNNHRRYFLRIPTWKPKCSSSNVIIFYSSSFSIREFEQIFSSNINYIVALYYIACNYYY